MYPAINAVLPKSGIVANMNIEARDGPLYSDSAGFLSLFHYEVTDSHLL